MTNPLLSHFPHTSTMNDKLIHEWANSPDKDLSESCKMVIVAAREQRP